MKEEIRNQIRSHMDRHKIMAQERDVEEMANAVEKGTYAFNIIYLDIADPSFDSVLNSFSPLDAAKIVFRPGTEEISEGIRGLILIPSKLFLSKPLNKLSSLKISIYLFKR